MRSLLRGWFRRIGSSRNSSSRRRPSIEQLETRVVPATVPTIFSPAQIQAAYGFNQIAFASGGTTYSEAKGNLGAGQTIAIIDAYYDPNIASDLAVFDKQWSLPTANLTVAVPTGRNYISSGWALETSLDVEWAHAMAPGANILLVSARTASLSDLLSAVNYANSNAGVSVVSMSWGSSEFAGETGYDSYFSQPGITYVASAGDSPGAIWPSVSSNVVAVGGTTLTLNGKNYAGETAWSSTGGGTSAYVSEPTYQDGAQSSGKRTTPDLAYNADPNTGYYVYDSVPYDGEYGWWDVGGTSAGAPQVSALFAIANQERALAGQGALSSSQSLTALYSLSSSDFHSVTGGSVTTTGRGTPIANLLVPALASYNTGTSAAAATPSTNSPSDPQSNNPPPRGSDPRHHFPTDAIAVSLSQDSSVTLLAGILAAQPSGASIASTTAGLTPHLANPSRPIAPLGEAVVSQDSGGGVLSTASLSEQAVQPDALMGPNRSDDGSSDLPEDWSTPGKKATVPGQNGTPEQPGDAPSIPGQTPPKALEQPDQIRLTPKGSGAEGSRTDKGSKTQGSWLAQPLLPLFGFMALIGGWGRSDRDEQSAPQQQKPRRKPLN